MGRWQYRTLMTVGIFAILYFMAALTTRIAISNFLQPKIQAVTASVKSNQDKILADLKLLDSAPVFVNLSQTKDAQPFISGHIKWQSSQPESDKGPENKALLALQTDVPRYAGADDLRRLAADPRIANVDVAWVDQLETYDHWNLASASIYQNRLAFAKGLDGVARIGAMASLPMPDFTLFRYAVFVRFLQLQKQGQALAGLKLIRQASYLLQSTGTLIGMMSAVAMLGNEYAAVETFGVTDWKLVEKERIAALKRVSWAWGGVMHLADWDVFPNEMLIYMKPSNGICPMILEKAMSLGVQEFLLPTVPLEPDFSMQLQNTNQWNQKLFSLCSMSEYQFLLDPPSQAVKPTLMARIPFARRAAGLTLMIVSMPSYMRQYEGIAASASEQ